MDINRVDLKWEKEVIPKMSVERKELMDSSERKEFNTEVVIKFDSYYRTEYKTCCIVCETEPYVFKPLEKVIVFDDHLNRFIIDLTKVQHSSTFPFYTGDEIELAVKMINMRRSDTHSNCGKFLTERIVEKYDFIHNSFIPVLSILYYLSEVSPLSYLLHYFSN